MPPEVKICGIKTVETIDACAKAGVHYLGFNFFAPSPRSISPETAGSLARRVPSGIKKVALTVDASDDELDAILKLFPADILQLHGSETPARIEAIKTRTGKPIIKALGVADADDIEEITVYEAVADYFLFDARPPKEAALPGGNALSFDWTLLHGMHIQRPWFLAGGLNSANLAEAIGKSGARKIDIASGVESSRGVKDAALIAALMNVVNRL